jgi:hypothetical protein
MDAAKQAVTATWTFTTGDFTRPEVVGTVPERESQGAPPEEVIVYSEDVSTAAARFALTGPAGPVAGDLTYYNDLPSWNVGPSRYRWHLKPDAPLSTGSYRAEVFGVTDRAGLGMEAPYAWSFEVSDDSEIELLAPPGEAPRAAEPAEVPETVDRGGNARSHSPQVERDLYGSFDLCHRISLQLTQ